MNDNITEHFDYSIIPCLSKVNFNNIYEFLKSNYKLTTIKNFLSFYSQTEKKLEVKNNFIQKSYITKEKLSYIHKTNRPDNIGSDIIDFGGDPAINKVICERTQYIQSLLE